MQKFDYFDENIMDLDIFNMNHDDLIYSNMISNSCEIDFNENGAHFFLIVSNERKRER